MGALTMQSDIGVPTVGAVVDALGLPGIGSKVAERCSNKILTRQALAAAGVPQPDFRVCASAVEVRAAAQALGLPCVVKAPDSSGSRGIVRIDTLDEAEAAFAEAMRFTRGSEVLVESFVRGEELGAQTFSWGGRCRAVILHDDVLSPPPIMLPVGHVLPCRKPKATRERAEVAVARCVEALGIHSGPSNVDFILDEQGGVQILEVGARIGATCLPELMTLHTGIDWVAAAVSAAIGREPKLVPSRAQPCAAFILYSERSGQFAGSELLDASGRQTATVPEDLPGIVEWEVTAREGDCVQALRKGTDRIGKVVAVGASADEAERHAETFRNRLQIRVV